MRKNDKGWNALAVIGRKAITTDHVVRGVFANVIGNGNHDGVIIRNVVDPYVPMDDYILRVPSNIKSATHNNGNFSRGFDEIYKQTATTERNNAQQVEANNLEWALRISSKQLETVRRLYQGTDKWMKAPNGQSTNLTEKQWLQVRTPNFKRWFGDWEKHPENASKAIDRNGEPLVVYRGTPKGDTINPDGSHSRVFNTEGFNGSGSFYSSNINFANSYAGLDNIKTGKSHVYSIFLNLRNPFIVDARNNGWTEIPFNGKNYTTNELAQKVRSGKIGDGVVYDGVIVKNVSDWGVEEAGITDTNILVLGEQLVIEARDGLINEEGYREEDITPEDIDRYINENPNISNRAKRMYKQYLEQNFADDFIVFNRNAIKSATGNNGAFGTETGDIYKQIIGIDGARRLDEAEGVTTRMDNLRLAKSMERNGSPTAKIWAATGWTRGAEGKWRYEIPDGKINRKKLEQLRKIANEFQALNDFYDNNPNHNDTQEEIDHYNALESSYYAKLSDVFDAPELFTAYPDLRDIGVWIDNNLNAAAEYDSLTNSIIISGYNTNFSKKRELRKNIIHEIQHAVQVREGFALGSNYDNTDTLYKRYVNKVHSLWDKLGEKLQRKVKEILKAQDNGDIYRMQSWINALSDNEFALYNAWAEAVEKAKQRSDYLFSKYERHSGEVEARNAEARAYWSEKRRRNTPLGRSEDISRDKHIIGRLPKKSSINNFITAKDIERFDQLVTHATGHIILDNRFDLRYIGTGEGTKAFGYGAYFEESPAVAQVYRKAGLINRGKGIVSVRTYDGKTFSQAGVRTWTNNPDSDLSEVLNDTLDLLLHNRSLSHDNVKSALSATYNNRLKELSEELEQIKRNPNTKTSLFTIKGASRESTYNRAIQSLQNKIQFVNSISDASISNGTVGNVYHADIPENFELLNWDETLENQPDYVLRIVKTIVNNINSNIPAFYAHHYAQFADNPQKAEPKLAKIFLNLLRKGKNFTYSPDFEQSGEYSQLKRIITNEKIIDSIRKHIFTAQTKKLDMRTSTGADLYHTLDNMLPTTRDASMYLNSYGIPGHKYWDEYSRSVKSGTHNFVIWNTDKIKIVGVEGDKEAIDYFRDTILKQLTGNPNETYNQVIGEKGAELIDRAIGAQWLTYNLDLAKKLKQLGFKPRSIRRVTGWELGHEGKWKFEVPDGSLKDNIRLEAVEPNIDPFNDNSIFSDIPFGFETQPFARTTLGNIFNSTELFAAYPQLKDITVTFVQGNDFEDNGIHYPNGSTSEDLSITLEGDFHFDGSYLYPNANDSTILTLLHEIQHAIQHIEIFAGGSNMDLAVRNSPAVKKFDRRIDALQKKLSTLYRKPNFTTDEEALFGNNPQSQEYYDLERKLYALIDEKERFIQNAMTDGTARNLYKRSAGETEARNIMTRHGMTEQQRRDTLLSDTEDFRHEELLDENGETYNQTANQERNNVQQLEADNLEWALRISRKQLETVRRLYQGTDKWMKAPNGQSTNLTEKQWLQVRTPNFKHWFGDWERHPESASKVVDNNGEPLVVYHGTPHGGFSVFDVGGATNQTKGTGAYFTSSVSGSEFYANYAGSNNPDKQIYPVFLNIRNPYIHDAQGRYWAELGLVWIEDHEGFPIYHKQDGSPFLSTYDALDYIRDVLHGENEKDDLGYDRYEVLHDTDYNTTDDIIRGVWDGDLGDGNHDGVIFRDICDPYEKIDEFITRTPTNIKSATNNNGMFGVTEQDIYKQTTNPKEADNSNTARSVDSFLTPEARRQVNAIRKKYKNTPDWMKAPNGKPTKLSELQWLMVRTPNFKRWFGDWENNQQNASKVLDENGEPLVVFHGTTVPIESIRKFKRGTEGWLGPGIYFTWLKMYANHFSDKGDAGIMHLFLNLRNPLSLVQNNPVMELLTLLYGDRAEAIYNERYNDIYGRNLDKFYELYQDEIDNPFVKEDIDRYIKRYIVTRDEIDRLLAQGYDGIAWDFEYSVIKPTQVKSATGNNGEYSLSNDEIYKQQDRQLISKARNLADHFGLFGDNTAERYLQHFGLEPADEYSPELRALLERNKRAEPAFRSLMDNLYRELGGKLILRKQMKSPERIIIKANRLFGGNISKVGDVWAGTLAFDTEDELLDAFSKLRQRNDLITIRNRWTKPKVSTGYRDIISYFRLNDGTVVELQLQMKDVQDVKDNAGHFLYEFISNNQDDYELHDLVWDTGDLSKRLYSAAVDGTYKALSDTDKNILRSLAQSLANSQNFDEAQEAIDDISDFLDKVLPEHKNSDRETQIAVQHNTDSVSSIYIQENEHSIIVPISELHFTERVTYRSVQKARSNMERAIHGNMPKREPLKVRLRHDGGYDIIDGNNTYAVLKELGAKFVPIEVLGSPYSSERHSNASFREQRSQLSVSNAAVSSSTSINEPSGDNKYTRPDGIKSSGMSSSPARYSTANGAPSTLTKYSNILNSSNPDIINPDNLIMGSETYYQIGAKRKHDMDTALARHRPDMTPQQRAEAITEY